MTERETILTSLSQHLNKNSLVHSAEAVTNAKVPIVKFVLRDEENGAEIDCDISLYNELVSCVYYVVLEFITVFVMWF